jgi:predicted ATPase
VWKAETHRVRGELLCALHDTAAAEVSFYRAISIARRQRARLLELTAALSLARLWCDQGERTKARDLVAPIYDWFTEGFDTPVLRDGRVLLDKLD